MMRSVCFVDRLEFEFSGNHYSNAITIGDVDNDKHNELVVGNVDGVLAIFKGDKLSKPWKKCSELGTVTCVGIGDIMNCGSNAIVVVNAERQCYVFVISPSDKKSPPLDSSKAGASSEHQLQHGVSPGSRSKSMKPLHSCTLEVPNVKALSISKLGGSESKYALYVGNTDRSVVVYRWNDGSKQLDMIIRRSLPGQIGSLSESVLRDRSVQLLVSQPGGTYVTLRATETSPFQKDQNSTPNWELGGVVGQAQRSSPTSSTEVVGSIRSHSWASTAAESETGSGDDTLPNTNDIVALCTLDGVVRLLRDKKKQWELQVDHSLFFIGKIDVTGDGSDEIVVCAWDGTTYLVDLNRNCVRFHFDQNVCGFCCGYYGVSEGEDKPCLVYTTFSNMIYLYHNITLPTIPASNLLLTMQAKASVPPKMQDQLLLMDSKEKQELFSQSLYSYKNQRTESELPDSHDSIPIPQPLT